MSSKLALLGMNLVLFYNTAMSSSFLPAQQITILLLKKKKITLKLTL